MCNKLILREHFWVFDGKFKHLIYVTCGSTWYMAKEIIGTDIKDAPPKAGLLIQHYPCRATRGDLGGIHESGELHKQAFIKALENKE